MHLVSLARALSTDAQLIIFDETTAGPLPNRNRASLRGHRGAEVPGQGDHLHFAQAGRGLPNLRPYTVLRDGVLAGTGDIADATEADIIRAMVGRTLDDVYPKAEASFGDTVLEVDGFCHATEFDDVSFDLKAGEILGFYGLVGAGRTEVMEALFGLKARKAGELRISGAPANIRSPRTRSQPALPTFPRTGSATAPFSRFPWFTTCPCRSSMRSPAMASWTGAARSSSWTISATRSPSRRPDGTSRCRALGRKPAKSGHRQVAGDPSPHRDPGRADQGESTSAPRPQCIG